MATEDNLDDEDDGIRNDEKGNELIEEGGARVLRVGVVVVSKTEGVRRRKGNRFWRWWRHSC
ncbi:hypothetical protein HYC85_023633 [Camellia sinensis]|uniref:Uncharacterized protein n=1 Tax=Camellia sinensis TaxID=4442 RepID=A0A7J7GIV7_CAMSI|nr:hypothetical protein HYC85_023633 [Camellia sinensis]